VSASSDKDWVAEMFSALRDCGEDISIVFGQADAHAPTEAEVSWHELPHDQYDGVSGLAALLAKQGLSAAALPVLREGRPSFLRRARGVLSVLRYLGIRRQKWTIEYDWERPRVLLPPGERVAWSLFDVEQTAAMLQAAKTAGVTVNSYLLAHLDAAVRGTWVPADAGRRWMLPVNLRGAVVRPAESPPHMSFLTVDVSDTPTAKVVQTQIDGYLRKGQHWGMWALLQLGRLLGEEGMRKDIRKRERMGHGATGMFSNLGVWNIAGGGSWIFCPAITRVYPIGAGCITVNGRMALTLQLHDALDGSLDKARTTLDAWVQSCLTTAAAHGAKPAVADPPHESNFATA
jgi:hypothetical protein